MRRYVGENSDQLQDPIEYKVCVAYELLGVTPNKYTLLYMKHKKLFHEFPNFKPLDFVDLIKNRRLI